jgi:hypothetical protein
MPAAMQDAAAIVSSQHRLARVRALPVPWDEESLRGVAGDRGDAGGYFIYRNATPPDGSYTLATVLFDPTLGRATVMTGHPAAADRRTERRLGLADW